MSAGAQVLIVILLFITGRRIAGFKGGFFAAVLGSFSAGLTQAGHFLTAESLLGLFGLVILFCLLKYFAGDKEKNIWLALAAIVLGLGVGTKVSFAVFALPLFGRALIFSSRKSVGASEPRSRALARHARRACEQVSVLLGLFIVAISIFLLTNPFILTKWSDVRSTFEYETRVATGSLPVFYTRQFLETVPGWFQAIYVFPQVTGWLFLPMFFVGVFVVCFQESPGSARKLLVASMLAALLSFLPLWAKWTRYAVQVLPILILIAGVGASWVWEKGRLGKAAVILTIVSFLPQFISTLQVYGREDTRVKAAKWAEANIPQDARIFTEAMDLGILPFNPIHGQNIKLFNFYELDEVQAEEKQSKLDSLLNESDYFIILSRRVYKNSLDHSDKFPLSAKFYQSLFDGSSGYNLVYQSPLIPYSLLLTPAEETFEVFDNPKVMIFEK